VISYDIPSDCICLGDGLMGMKCTAKKHAKRKITDDFTLGYLVAAAQAARAEVTKDSSPLPALRRESRRACSQGWRWIGA